MAFSCLIVDDNAPFLDAARALLEREGVDVTGVASSSSDALAQAEALRPDVVLVDVMLGEESGVDLARRLAEMGMLVVMISTHAQSEVEDLVAGSSAASFLPKSELSAAALQRILDSPGPDGGG